MEAVERLSDGLETRIAGALFVWLRLPPGFRPGGALRRSPSFTTATIQAVQGRPPGLL